jgi:membrane protease subunit (stomatin/prohibitin family)
MNILNFFRGNEGGFMDVINSGSEDYLVEKWSPNGDQNTTGKESAIRYGSRLILKPHETALFFYNDGNKSVDVIEGPANETIKTANFPVLTRIVGALYGGESPFTAEVYFFNRQRNIQIKFGIPYFDVFDNRLPDLPVPCAVRGTLTFNVTDVLKFVEYYRLQHFTLQQFEEVIKDFITSKIKFIVTNLPVDTGLPIMQLERRIEDINQYILDKINTVLAQDFSINVVRLDISAIELDKSHPFFLQLKAATADQQTRFIDAKTGIEITNLDEMARIQRKDAEMGVEGKNFAVHQLNQQADILKTAANNLGEMANVNLGNGGFNPLGIMAGMSVGGAMGSQMSNMMGNLSSTPPPPPAIAYHIALNGQQSGPFSIEQLKEYATTGQFTKQHYVWKPGMSSWEAATDAQGLSGIFETVVPPPPPPAE